MKAVSRLWEEVSIYMKALSFLAVLFCIFTFATPQTQAAGLTEQQLNEVAALLQSFGTDQATINQVIVDLGGTITSTPTSPVFNASPTSGNAQLSVVFTGAPRPACPGLIMEKQTRINFGDGEVAQVANCGNFTVGHLYRTAGTFTATLETAPFSNQAPVWTVLGTKTITANIPFTVTPTSGNAPLTVSFIGAARPACPGLAIERQTRITFGDGQTQTVTNCGDFSITHTYTTAGTYTAKLESAPAGTPTTPTWTTIGTASIVVSQVVVFNATPVLGVVPAAITFKGAARPACPGLIMEKQTRINFGDGEVAQVANCGDFSVSHTYTTAGTYSAKLETAPAGTPVAPTWSTLGTVSVTINPPVSTSACQVLAVSVENSYVNIRVRGFNPESKVRMTNAVETWSTIDFAVVGTAANNEFQLRAVQAFNAAQEAYLKGKPNTIRLVSYSGSQLTCKSIADAQVTRTADFSGAITAIERTFLLIGSGVAAVFEGYMSLFR